MNQKGQALVEFILVMPIIALMFIALIDIGSIFVQKYELNNSLETVSTYYQNNQKNELNVYLNNENITLSENKNNDMVTLTLKKNIKISAPVLSNVLGKNYILETSKTIYIKGEENG